MLSFVFVFLGLSFLKFTNQCVCVMTDYDFDGRVRLLCGKLGVGEEGIESSQKVCEVIRGEVDGFRHRFSTLGGYDVFVAVCVFVGVRRSGVPVSAAKVVEEFECVEVFSAAEFFSESKLRGLAGDFSRELGFEVPVFDAEDFLDYFMDCFDGGDMSQELLKEEMNVSHVAVREAYKSIVEDLTGLDTAGLRLEDMEVTPKSFGYGGDSFEEFAYHLENRFESGAGSPRVVAAGCIYIAGKLI